MGSLTRVGVCLLALCAPACGDGSGESAQPATTPVQGPTNSEVPTKSVDCEEPYVYALFLSTDTPSEMPYLQQMAACTDSEGSATYIVNDSDVAWALRSTGLPALVDHLGPASFNDLILEGIEAQRGSAVMAPHSRVIVHASPDLVRWDLLAGVSAGWIVDDYFVSKMIDAGTTEFTEALTADSPRARALVTCALAANAILGDNLEKVQSVDFADVVFGGLGVYGEATECSHDWVIADDAAREKFGFSPVWETEIKALGKDSEVIHAVEEEFSGFKAFAEAALVLAEHR